MSIRAMSFDQATALPEASTRQNTTISLRQSSSKMVHGFLCSRTLHTLRGKPTNESCPVSILPPPSPVSMLADGFLMSILSISLMAHRQAGLFRCTHLNWTGFMRSTHSMPTISRGCLMAAFAIVSSSEDRLCDGLTMLVLLGAQKDSRCVLLVVYCLACRFVFVLVLIYLYVYLCA